MLEEIKKTAAFIDAATDSFAPEVGVILGTGLGGFADKIETRFAIEYKDIPGFPVSTVEGHKGRMIFGMAAGSWPCRAVSTITKATACSR